MNFRLISLYWPFLIIIATAIFFRVFLLDLFPVSIIPDELNYVLNAKSLWFTGHNIPLTASALFSWGETNFDIVISEVPSYITSLWIGPHSLNHFNARIPYAFFVRVLNFPDITKSRICHNYKLKKWKNYNFAKIG